MPLIFLHIPRTGGTTLTRIARRQYPANQIYMIDSRDPAGSAAALSLLPGFARERLALVAGHASFGVHRQLGGGRYVTLIRDPVQRVLSHYRYAQQRSEHPMHQLARTTTLDEMLRDGRWHDLSNGQCRALAGDEATADGTEPEAMFELARANLAEHFALWGLMERYAETLLMARAALGWQHLYYAPENATRPAPPSRKANPDLEAVRRHNEFDIALYAELEATFQHTLDALVPDWPHPLARLKLESTLDEPRRRLRRSYEQTRLRLGKRPPSPDPADPPSGDGGGFDPTWLRRWVVGGYDWQVGQKEWMRRRIVGEYSWGRISESFDFVEGLLRPCGQMNLRAAYDVGCGAGYVSFALASYFETVLAVDQALRPVLRAELLARGSHLERIRFVRADAGRFDPAQRFDLILCNLMSHFGAGRLRLLHRLANLADQDGWIVYAEEAQGYAPMEIEAAISERNALGLRTRLRQLLAGIRGDHAFRFFVEPSAERALEAFGFEVVKEERTWWRSLPTTQRIWCRRTGSPPPDPTGADADYLVLPEDLLELRSRSASEENQLAPLLVLADMARWVLPHVPQEIDGRMPPLAVRAVDSIAGPGLDWKRVEDGFARFVEAVDRSSSRAPLVPHHEDAVGVAPGLPVI